MKTAVFCALGLLVAAFLFTWLITRIRYRIGSKHVKVLLFGVCIRRLAFTKIESTSKRRGDGWVENWSSTMKPKHRLLVLRRKSGLFKNFVITPKNRYVFKTDLERAMQRAGTPMTVSQAEPIEPEAGAEAEPRDRSEPRSDSVAAGQPVGTAAPDSARVRH